MSTMTSHRARGGTRGGLPARGLPIPLPSRHREKVVTEALEQLKEDYEEERKKAESTIKRNGLTIEVARLRDRLDRAATTDLQRLLLSTPGVPEKLFNQAIAAELKEEQEDAAEEKKEQDSQAALLAALIDKLDKLDKLDEISEIADALKERHDPDQQAGKPAIDRPSDDAGASS